MTSLVPDLERFAVAFRVDAGAQIGSGHVMRTLTLAEALKRRGAQVRFVSRHMPAHFQRMLVERGHEFVALAEAGGGGEGDDLAHAPWLGTSQAHDANQTAQALSDRKWNWLIVDHYALDSRWETRLRPFTERIMVVDDLADRVHDCDVLLDQNLIEGYQSRYVGKVSASCRTLLGPHYALLQPVYAEMHLQVRPRSGPIRRIFLYFGAGDRHNITGRSIAAFLQLGQEDIEVDVVLGSDSSHLDSILQQVAGHPRIHLHSGLATIAPLLAAADLAIGACGATSWERLCLGLPAIVVTLAENQRPVAAFLHGQNLVHWVGNNEEADQQAIAQALERLLHSSVLADWSRRSLRICNGRGAQEVLRVMADLSGNGFSKARPSAPASYT